MQTGQKQHVFPRRRDHHQLKHTKTTAEVNENIDPMDSEKHVGVVKPGLIT